MKFEHSDSFASPVEFYTQLELGSAPIEYRSGGSFGVQMMVVEQENVDQTDPPYDCLTILALIDTDELTGRLDFGDGWLHHKAIRSGCYGPHPAHQECHFEIPGRHKLIAASIPHKAVCQLLSDAGFTDDPFRSLYGPMSNDPHGLPLLKSMWRAMKADGPANTLAVDAAVINLLMAMIHAAGEGIGLEPPPHPANPKLARVIDYIETYYNAPLLMSELAAIAAMSTVHFGRSFKRETGISPHAYVMRRRVEHAKVMLRDPTLTITEIAYACGFSSAAHFSTVIKAQLGATPSAYRKVL